MLKVSQISVPESVYINAGASTTEDRDESERVSGTSRRTGRNKAGMIIASPKLNLLCKVFLVQLIILQILTVQQFILIAI